jgi:hypothetical protein
LIIHPGCVAAREPHCGGIVDLRLRSGYDNSPATTGTFYGQAMTAGDICTVAGTGRCAFGGYGSPASSAGLCLNGPLTGLATNPAENLLIDDFDNMRVCMVSGGPHDR